MVATDDPTSEEHLVDMLIARNGRRTRITTVNDEPMKVMRVEITDLPSAYEWDHYAEIGGIGLSADGGNIPSTPPKLVGSRMSQAARSSMLEGVLDPVGP